MKKQTQKQKQRENGKETKATVSRSNLITVFGGGNGWKTEKKSERFFFPLKAKNNKIKPMKKIFIVTIGFM